MQASQSREGKDTARGCGTSPVVGRSLPESKMRAVFVVVADVFREQPLQMLFVDCNDMIQQISSTAFNPTLRHTILPGAFERSPHRTYLQRSNSDWDFQSVFPIPVENQEPRC